MATLSPTDPYWLSEANNGPGSMYDSTSTFTGTGTDPRYLPGGQYYNQVSAYNPGGSVLGSSTTASAPAPAYSAADVSSFNTQKSNIYNSANDWTKNYAVGLSGSISDYINNLKQGQQGLDERGVQNELGLKQGRAGVLDMVSRGIRSGGVTLANRNAGDSSASAALANAYGDLGRRQLSGVGNQYSLENRNIGLAQDQFSTNAASGARKIHDSETQDVAGAVQNARDSLAALDAWAADKSLPERIQVEQEKSNIQNMINNMLGQFGTQLDQGVAGVQPTSQDQRRSTAAELAGAGTAAENPFDFTSQIPAQFQNSGPSSGNLPIYTYPRKKTA